MMIFFFIMIVYALAIVPFDHYIFTRIWDSTRNKVIIHGLWPNWKNNSWPQYCKGTQHWNYSLISDLEPELKDRWSDIGIVDTKWWKHEWDKHGTCALGSPLINSQLQYFATSLWLDMWLGANGRLQKYNGNKVFTQQQLVDIFEATPICIQNSTNFSHLSELRIKVNLQLNTFEPTQEDSGCNNLIYL